jgi:hypothetical protein
MPRDYTKESAELSIRFQKLVEALDGYYGSDKVSSSLRLHQPKLTYDLFTKLQNAALELGIPSALLHAAKIDADHLIAALEGTPK